MSKQIEEAQKMKGAASDKDMVRLIADKFTLTAQELLETDKVLQPVALVVSEKQSVLFKVTHENPEEKQLAYTKLRAYAKLTDAHAIIAVGDGTIKTKDDVNDAILTVVRAKSGSYAIVVPYYKHDINEKQEMIVFMDPYDWTGSEIPLIEAWW